MQTSAVPSGFIFASLGGYPSKRNRWNWQQEHSASNHQIDVRNRAEESSVKKTSRVGLPETEIMLFSFCHLPIDRTTASKGIAERYYCSEFCANSDNVPALSQKDQMDRRYLQRLKRLLALRQASGIDTLSALSQVDGG